MTLIGSRAHRIAFRKAAVLDQRDTSKRECRSIVAQCHAVQGAEGITRFERTRRGCNQRLHLEYRHTCYSHRSISGAKLSHDQ